MKPLHAQWVMDLYNYLTSEKGQAIISNGWKAAAITLAISNGSKGLESLDRFESIDPLDEPMSVFETSVTLDADVESFVMPKDSWQNEEEFEDEWEPSDGDEMRNIFEVLEDNE